MDSKQIVQRLKITFGYNIQKMNGDKYCLVKMVLQCDSHKIYEVIEFDSLSKLLEYGAKIEY